MQLFSKVQGNREMLFLRNIESCSLHHITKQKPTPQLIWQAQIKNMTDSCREVRKSVINETQIYQLDIERIDNQNKKVSEMWLLCTGGHDKIKPEFEDFSKEKRLKVNVTNELI